MQKTAIAPFFLPVGGEALLSYKELMKAITQGLMDIKAGDALELDEVKKRLDIN